MDIQQENKNNSMMEEKTPFPKQENQNMLRSSVIKEPLQESNLNNQNIVNNSFVTSNISCSSNDGKMKFLREYDQIDLESNNQENEQNSEQYNEQQLDKDDEEQINPKLQSSDSYERIMNYKTKQSSSPQQSDLTLKAKLLQEDEEEQDNNLENKVNQDQQQQSNEQESIQIEHQQQNTQQQQVQQQKEIELDDEQQISDVQGIQEKPVEYQEQQKQQQHQNKEDQQEQQQQVKLNIEKQQMIQQEQQNEQQDQQLQQQLQQQNEQLSNQKQLNLEQEQNVQNKQQEEQEQQEENLNQNIQQNIEVQQDQEEQQQINKKFVKSNNQTPIKSISQILQSSRQQSAQKNSVCKLANSTNFNSNLKEAYSACKQQFSQSCTPIKGEGVKLIENSKLTWEQKIRTALQDLGLEDCIQILSKSEKEFIQNVCMGVSYISEINDNQEILFQVISYLLQDLVIVITNNHLQLPDKLKTCKNKISWASINNIQSFDQKQRILNHVTSNSIQLLFASPEVLLQDNCFYLPVVGALIFADGISIIDYAYKYRIPDYYSKIVEKVNSQSISIMSNITNNQNIESLKQFSDITKTSRNVQSVGPKFDNITFSRDEDRLKAISSFLRNPKIISPRNKSYILMYCDNKKQVEELTNKLNSAGFKAHNMNTFKTENQKYDLQQSFLKGNFDILVVCSSQGVIKQVKEKAQMCLLYSISRSVDHFLEQIQFLAPSCLVHGFVNPDDYFQIRQELAQEPFSLVKFEIMMFQMFSEQQNLQNMEGKNSKKQSTQKIQNLEQSHISFYSIMDNNNQIQEDQNQIQQEEIEENNNFEIQQPYNQQNLKITQICNDLEIKKDHFWQCICLLEERGFIEIEDICAVEINLRILNNNSTKNLTKSILQNSHILQHIINFSKNQQGGIHKVDIVNISQDLQMSSSDLLKELKKLQSEKKILIEISEEEIVYNIKKTIVKEDINNLSTYIYEKLVKQENDDIKYLDMFTIMAKQISYNTIDLMLKYKKYTNITLQDKSRLFSQVPKVSSLNNSKNNTVKSKFNMRQFILNEYCNLSENISLQQIFQDYIPNVKDVLHYQKLNSQREKSNVKKDIDIIISKQLDTEFVNELEVQNKHNIQIRAKDIVMILQGMSSKNNNLKEWKASNIWKKYYKYDYQELMEVIIQFLNKYNINYEPQLMKKQQTNKFN